MKVRRRLAWSAFVTLLALGTLEAGLRLANVAPEDTLLSPLLFQRYPQLGSLRTEVQGGVRWLDGPATLRTPPGIRIALLGGSAVQGDKMARYGRFSNLLERRLAWRMGGAPVEVVNLGRGGIASRHVAEMLEATLDEGGVDLAVVYSGNNEFHELRALKKASPAYGPTLELTRRRLHGLRVYRALQRLLGRARVAPFEPIPAGAEALSHLDVRMDARDRDLAAALYRENLERMVAAARGRGIPLMLCTIPDNRRDFVDSSASAGLSPAGEAALVALEEAARRRDRTAVERIVVGHDGDLQTEVAQHRVGRSLLAVGAGDEARRHMDQSELLSERPTRSNRELRAIVREVGAEAGVPVCDLAADLDSVAVGGIAGGDLFLDPCHPNARGHGRIARTLLACLEREALPPFERAGSRAEVPSPLPADPYRLDHVARPLEAPDPDVGTSPGLVEALAAHRAFDAGRLDEALALYRRARDAGGPEGALLLDQGLVLLHQGRLAEGRERLEAARRVLPEDVELRRLLAVLTPP